MNTGKEIHFMFIENAKDKSKGKKTWIYEAQNVRDFAFNTSRRLVWDAMAVTMHQNLILIPILETMALLVMQMLQVLILQTPVLLL